MANVFLSYARRDRDRVLALASALEREGLSVWWDPNLVPGKRFRDIIAAELDDADSIVVVWTSASIQSDYVQDEAEEGRQRGVLVPITLEPVKPPAGFRQVQAADLSQWTGTSQHPEFRMVLAAIRALVEAARRAEADGTADPAVPAAPSAAPAAPAAGATPSAPHPLGRHDLDFVPRLFDLFALPAVWVSAGVVVALSGAIDGNFGLSGVAAAMELWAGATALSAIRANLGASAKTTVMIISVGLMLIIAASAHSLTGLTTSILVGGATFAGTTLIMIGSARGRRALRSYPRSERAQRVAREWQARAEERRRRRRAREGS